MTPFVTIRARAASRKGGEDVLATLLAPVMPASDLAAIPDDRMLAEMARRVFAAGFVWRVIDAKWPGFEEAFLRFQPRTLLFQPDEFWHDLAKDPRIVRNPQKIRSVRDNARFVDDIAREHGSFGRFLSQWPRGEQQRLLGVLSKRGSRLGGATGSYFLRFIGFDGYIASRDAVLALRDAGLDIAEQPTSKGDLAKVEAAINGYAQESGLPVTHVSRILAMSIGENVAPETLRSYIGADEGAGA